jgi:hypothetical protein
MAILNRFNRDELGNTIEVLVALLDIWDGDPDSEPNGDDEAREADGDTRDISWPEWQERGRHKATAFGHEMPGTYTSEDDEDDDPDTGVEDSPGGFDPEEDCCVAADDRICSGSGTGAGGAFLNDLGPGDATDCECEQMGDDVPMLRVFTAEHNIFNDQRTYLGLSNLQSSYRADGGEVISADSGARLVPRDLNSRKPGSPV